MPRFTRFRPDVRFLGSTLTLVLGAMYFLGGVAQIAEGVNSTGPVVGPVNNAGPVVGPMMFLGALAYRSRKRRRLGLRRTSVLRWSLEMLTLPNLLIPLWIIAAYFCAGGFRRRRPKTG